MTTMNASTANALFQLALALRAAYPYRSLYDRRSSLSIAQAVAYGQRLLAASDCTARAADPIWQPGQ
jgi:hypothetical protein